MTPTVGGVVLRSTSVICATRGNAPFAATSQTKGGILAMTYFASPIRAALICAFLWLSVSTAQAANSDCQLIFEAIPSKDAGSIIGGEVSHKLATKNFVTWRAFTHQQATVVAGFFNMNFENIAKFGEPTEGLGGFEGKSSPNAFIELDFEQELQGDALGKAISEITAAVGYMLIQDGTVANCKEPAGANESIDWLLLSGQVYITATELGICYVFGAALSVNV